MSISSPSDGKVVPPTNDDVESRRVGAANETSLAFIGGRRHSWMLSASTQPPPVRTLATGIRKKKQVSKSLAKNLPLRTTIKDAVSLDQNQNQAQEPNGPGEPAEVFNTSSDNNHVLSPSPTAAPILVNRHEDSESLRTTSSNTPPPSTEPEVRQDKLVGQSTTEETRMDDSSEMNPITTQKQPHVQSSPCQNSRSNPITTASTPMGPPQQDGTGNQPTRQLPHHIMVEGSVYQLVTSVPPPLQNPHISQRTNSTSWVSGGGSHQTYPSSQPAQHGTSMAQGNLAVWLQMFIDFMNGPNGPGNQIPSLKDWRCSCLIRACSDNDPFFIYLHQFYCLWSTDQPFLHSILPVGRGVFNMAFELLARVLRPNTRLMQHDLSWFAHFPFNPNNPASADATFEDASSKVVKFLTSFSQRWPAMEIAIIQRGYPLTVQELTEVLDCHSALLQTMLFTLSWSVFAPANSAIAGPFARIFQEDKLNEAQATNHPQWPYILQVRQKIRQKYVATINQWIIQNNYAETARLTAAQSQSHFDVNRQPNTAEPTVALASPPFNPSHSGGFSSTHSASGPRMTPGHGHPIQVSRPTQYSAQVTAPQLQGNSTVVPVRRFIPQARQNSSNQFAAQFHNHFSQHRGFPAYASRPQHPNPPRFQQPSRATEEEYSVQERQPQNEPVNADARTRMAPIQQRTVAGDRFSTAPLAEAECPQSPYDWTSVQSGLHLVRSRSPMRVSAGVPGVRYYQFLDRFAIEPTILRPNKGTIQVFDFTVTAAEFADISQAVRSEEIRIHQFRQGSLRYRLKIIGQLPKDKTSDVVDWATSPCVWPTEIYCIFNGKSVFPRRPQHFHQHLPIELTDTVQQGFNTLKISLPQTTDNYKAVSTYHLAVEILSTMDHESTLALVDELGRISAEQTRSELARRLRPSDSDDIIVQGDSLCISLMDPFSASMVELPVRGMRCKHVECFDLEIWLQTRRGKPSQSLTEPALADGWKCPICGEDAGPRSLRSDEFLMEVRKSLVEAGKIQTKSINVTMDGNWTANEEDKDEDDDGADGGSVTTTMAPRKAEPDVIEILDD